MYGHKMVNEPFVFAFIDRTEFQTEVDSLFFNPY